MISGRFQREIHSLLSKDWFACAIDTIYSITLKIRALCDAQDALSAHSKYTRVLDSGSTRGRATLSVSSQPSYLRFDDPQLTKPQRSFAVVIPSNICPRLPQRCGVTGKQVGNNSKIWHTFCRFSSGVNKKTHIHPAVLKLPHCIQIHHLHIWDKKQW